MTDTLSMPMSSSEATSHVVSGISRLTKRESEVCELLIAGHTSKQAARNLGISNRTVEIHRSRIFEKTCVPNLIELMRALWSISTNSDVTQARQDRLRSPYRELRLNNSFF